MKLYQHIRKSYLTIRTIFHKEDCGCDLCIKQSLIGRCGMGERMNPTLSVSTSEYLTNRFILHPPYELWVKIGKTKWYGDNYFGFLFYKIWKWIGERNWFGMSMYERFVNGEELMDMLESSFKKCEIPYSRRYILDNSMLRTFRK